MKILKAIKIHIVIFSIMRPYSPVVTKPLKEHNSCNFTKKTANREEEWCDKKYSHYIYSNCIIIKDQHERAAEVER